MRLWFPTIFFFQYSIREMPLLTFRRLLSDSFILHSAEGSAAQEGVMSRAVVTAARFPLYFEMYYLLGFTTSVNFPPLQALLRVSY